jgi:hypothetical protein
MKTLLTLDVLKTMSSDELEDYRAAGEDFRRELSHAVMRDLTSPSGWSVNAEYRCEFGGFFPVQIRFTPLMVTLMWRYAVRELNPRWIVVFVTRDGQPFSVVRVMDAFNPELITHTLDLIECLDAGGYSFASIISTLSQEGAQ